MNKWIPVTDQLPPDEGRVLTYSTPMLWNSCHADPCIVVGFYSVKYGEWRFPTESYNGRWEEHIEPTHWMPLPDPPKTEEKNN